MCDMSPRWGSITLQMEDRAKTSDDGRADPSEPGERLTLIISRRLDVGFFVLRSVNHLTLHGLLSTVSSLSRSGTAGTRTK